MICRDDEEPILNENGEEDPAAAEAAPAPVKKSMWARPTKKSHNKGGAGNKNKRGVASNKPKVVAPVSVAATTKPVGDTKVREPVDSDVDSGDESDNENEKDDLIVAGSSDDEKKQVSSVEDDDVEWEKFQQKLNKREKLEGKSKMSHSVHCPNFPEDKQEYWWTYICDRKSRTLLTAPYHVTNLVDAEEIQLKFTAPRWPGVYTFTVCLRSGELLFS